MCKAPIDNVVGMKTSVIIPTINRKETVLRLLACISAQTNLPAEIIIVEQGEIPWTASDLPTALQPTFRLIRLAPKSSALARATGQKAASGEILFFFDDDIILPNNYIEEALHYLTANPTIMAIGGVYIDKTIQSRKPGSFVIGRLFGIYADGRCNQLLASGWADYVRGKYTEEISCAEWLFGCNIAVRASTFSAVEFEARMQAWSFLDDVFFGTVLKEKFGECMRILPDLRVIHDPPASGGEITLATLRMRIIHRFILWRDHIAKHHKLSLFRFLLGMAANLLLMLKQERKIWVVTEHMKTFVFILRNLKMNWDKANEFIFSRY